MQVRRVRVQIETSRLRIIGTIRLPTEGYRSRTTDFLNAQDGFIAVTDAEMFSEETAPQRHEYLAVGARHIVAVAELEDLGVYEGELDAGPTIAGLGTPSVPPPAA